MSVMIVRMILMIMVIMIVMPVIVFMVVIMIVRMHIKLHAFDARLLPVRGMDVEIVQLQFRQFAFEFFERDPKIEQRADKHVAANPTENIEVNCFHFA